MAFSTETGGINFAAPAPNLAQYSALAELKPLSFAGGLQSPLEFRAMPAFTQPNTQPELVAQGIGKAMGSVAEGITAVFKSKADERKDQLKSQRDLQIAKVKTADSDARLNESERHNRAMEIIGASRLKEVAPQLNFGNTSYKRSEEETTPTEPQAPAPREPVKFFGREPETNYLRATEPVKSNELGYNAVDQQLPALDFGDIFSPTQIKYMSASNHTSGVLADVPSAVRLTPTNPNEDSSQVVKTDPVTEEKTTLGQLSAATFGDTSPVLNAFQGGDANDIYGYQTPAEAPAERPALSDVKPVSDKVPRSTFDSYPEAQKYMEDQDVNPNWYAAGTPEPNKQGKFVIPWKQNDPEMKASRKDAAQAREETSKTQQGLREQNTLNREAVMFQSHPAVKAFTAPNGMQQSFTRFVKDYDAIIKNPEGAGTSDVGLLDMFARAEGGGRVTEGQANLILGSMGLVDKAKTLGMKLEGGDRLSQNQRDQMLRVIAEDHDAQAKIANQAVQMTRAKLIKQGVKDEDSLPQPYISPKTKFEALVEINELKNEAIKLNAERQKAFASGNKSDSDKLKKQIEEIGKNAVELRNKIDKSKSSIINLHEIETTPQGWTGGAATTLIQQQ